jgi:hypothetical protein
MPGFAAPAPIPRYRTVRWRSVALWTVLLLGLPLAFLGLVVPANKYESWGGSGVDCDGPALLMFAIPAAVVYALGALVFIRRAVRRRWTGDVLMAVACIALVVALVNNIGNARREQGESSYQETCGE